MKPEIKEKMDFVSKAILFLLKETGLSVNSPEFKLMCKIDLDGRRFWFGRKAFDLLHDKFPGWSAFCSNIGYGFNTDDWGEGAHIRLSDDQGRLPDKLDIKDIAAVLYPRLILQPSPVTDAAPPVVDTTAPVVADTAAPPATDTATPPVADTSLDDLARIITP